MDKSVKNFKYNGFYVSMLPGKAPYEVENLVQWTNDPGIGEFMCSDGKKRFIPSCQVSHEFLALQPERPKLNPFEGIGVFFGASCQSI